MVEILEFVGYSFLGEGEGLLFYGTGDFGEWNNVSWDLISNTLGATSGSLGLLLHYKKKLLYGMAILLIPLFLFFPNEPEPIIVNQIILDSQIPRYGNE